MWQRTIELVLIALLVCLLSPTDAEGENDLTVNTVRARTIMVGDQLIVRTTHEDGSRGVVRIKDGKIEVWREPKGKEGLEQSSKSVAVLPTGLLLTSRFKIGLDRERVPANSSLYVSPAGFDCGSGDTTAAQLVVDSDGSVLRLYDSSGAPRVVARATEKKSDGMDGVGVYVLGSDDAENEVEASLTEDGLAKRKR